MLVEETSIGICRRTGTSGKTSSRLGPLISGLRRSQQKALAELAARLTALETRP
jgi:hypothetical protein